MQKYSQHKFCILQVYEPSQTLSNMFNLTLSNMHNLVSNQFCYNCFLYAKNIVNTNFTCYKFINENHQTIYTVNNIFLNLI